MSTLEDLGIQNSTKKTFKKCTKLLPLFQMESDHTVHSYVICFLILNLNIFPWH